MVGHCGCSIGYNKASTITVAVLKLTDYLSPDELGSLSLLFGSLDFHFLGRIGFGYHLMNELRSCCWPSYGNIVHKLVWLVVT